MKKFALYSSMLFPLPCAILSFLVMFPLFLPKVDDSIRYICVCGLICFVESLFSLIWNIVKVVKEGENDVSAGTDYVYKVSEYNFGLLSFISFTVFVSYFENVSPSPVSYIFVFLFFFSTFITSFISYILCKKNEDEALRLPWICIAPMVLVLFLLIYYGAFINVGLHDDPLGIVTAVFLYVLGVVTPGLLLIPFIYLRKYY